MTKPTVSSEIDTILSDLVWEFSLIRNGTELSQHTLKEARILERLELKAALSKLEELMVEARTAALLDSYISLKNGHDRGNLKVGNAEILLNAIDDRIKALKKGDK